MIKVLLLDILRDIRRRKWRALGIALTISLSLSLIPLLRNMEASTKASFKEIELKYAKPDVIVSGKDGFLPNNLSGIISSVRGVDIVEKRFIEKGFSIIGGENVYIVLYGIDGEPKINKIFIDGGWSWDSFRGNVALVDTSMAKILGLYDGDIIKVFSGGKELEFKIIKTVRATWSFTPRIPRVLTLIVPMKTLQDIWDAENLVTHYYIKISSDLEPRAVAEDVNSTLWEKGYRVNVEWRKIIASPHGNVSAIFSTLIIPTMIIALALLVAILLNKIASEYRLFGVRKAIGFTPRDIISYILLYTTILYIFSIPLTILLTYSTTTMAINLMIKRVIPEVKLVIDTSTIFKTLLFGYAVFLSVSLYPAYRASKTNAVKAISWGFEPQKYVRVSGVSRLPKLLTMAIRNVVRNKRRSALIVVILIITEVFIINVESIRFSVNEAYTSLLLEQQKFDIEILYNKPFNSNLVNLLSNESYVAKVEPFAVLMIESDFFKFYVGDKIISERLFSNPMIVFVEKPLSLYDPEILEGRYPEKLGEVIVSNYIHKKFGVGLGDAIKIVDLAKGISFIFKVVGVARLTWQRGWQFIAFMEDAYEAKYLPNGTYNGIFVKVSGMDAKNASVKIIELTKDFEPTAIILTETALKNGKDMVNILQSFMMAVASLIIFSAIVGLLIIFRLIYFDRRIEVAILKAIGASWGEIIKQQLYEILIYSTTSIIISMPIGFVSSKHLVESLNTIDLFLGTKYIPPIQEIPLLIAIPFIVLIASAGPTIYLSLKERVVKILREMGGG